MALLREGRRCWPEVCFAGLIDPELPPLPAEARACLDRLDRTTTGCFVQLRPGRDDPLFVARLLLDPSVPSVGVAGFVAEPGLEGAVRRYWVARLDRVVPASELWACAAGLVPRPGAAAPRPLDLRTLVALHSPRVAPIFVIGNTPSAAGLIRLLQRHGGSVRLTDSCLLAAYDLDAVCRLGEAELGRAVPADEARQWMAGVAHPPALFMAEVAAAADEVIVHSAWLAAEIAARYGREARLSPLPPGEGWVRAPSSGPALSRRESEMPRLSADCCAWALKLLAVWGVDVELGSVGLFLAMRGQGSLSAALAAAASTGLPCIASRSVREAVDVPALVLPDQPSPVLLAEAILRVLGRQALPRPSLPDQACQGGIYVDVSKLVDEPRRSGIQRVERELIRHWPGQPLLPCRFDAGTQSLRTLPPAILDILARDAPPGGLAEERRLLAPLLGAGATVDPEARVLVAELFDDADRAAHHAARSARTYWLLYDFLPWLHPEWFPAGPANRLMPYLLAAAQGRTGFISAATQRDFAERIIRSPAGGPVLPLGADGLGLERQSFDPARRDVVMLGTIEARKNAMAALHAFQALWRDGVDGRLVLIGAVEQDALAEQALLRELESEPRLVQCGPLPDAGVRDALRRARVLLFPSEGEGYGLPPMEALHAGIPVIVASGLPALAGLAGLGQLRLSRPDAVSIAGAVRSILDDAVAGRLWAEASRLTLPGWADFAGSVAEWVRAPESLRTAPFSPYPQPPTPRSDLIA